MTLIKIKKLLFILSLKNFLAYSCAVIDSQKDNIDYNLQLLNWAYFGNIQLVLNALENGADIEAKDSKENTPLMLAISQGHTAIIKKLLEVKADINSCNDTQQTPLHAAILKKNSITTNTLISRKANLEAIDEYGCTPLHSAAAVGNIFAIHELINAQANIEALSNSKSTPLHIAAEKGFIDSVKLLISLGSNINAQTVMGETPLYLAIFNNNINIAKILIELNANKDIPDEFGLPPFFLAILENNLEAVKFLIESRADVNESITIPHEYTGLHLAASLGHDKIIKLLIGAKADINLTLEKSALFMSVSKRHIKSFFMLLNCGANILKDPDKKELINIIGKNFSLNQNIIINFSPLMLAAISDDIEKIEQILRPLHFPNGTTEKIKRLIAKPKDPIYQALKLHPNLNETALTLAVKYDNYEAAKLIYKYLQPIRVKICEVTKILPYDIAGLIGEFLYGKLAK